MARRRRFPDAAEKRPRREEVSERCRDRGTVRPRLSLQARRYDLPAGVRGSMSLANPNGPGGPMRIKYDVSKTILIEASRLQIGWKQASMPGAIAAVFMAMLGFRGFSHPHRPLDY